MAFIDKKDPVVLNIKLTSKGRELLSKGVLNFKYFAIGDSEIDYEFNSVANHNPFYSNILRPADKNPSILSFISKNLSGDPYNTITNIPSTPTIIHNTTQPLGFFTITTGNTSFIVDGDHVKQPDAMIIISGVTGGTRLEIRQAPTYLANVNEPTIGDFILIKWCNKYGISTTGYSVNINNPTPYLVYKIQDIAGTLSNNNLIVIVDRELPNFSSLTGGSNNILAGALIYYNYINFTGDTIFNDNSTDFINDSVIAFLQNCQCPTITFPFWNMSIVYTEEIVGVQLDNKNFGDLTSKTYGGFVSYIQNQAPNYKKLGIIHYTNSSPSNTYAEELYQKTAILNLPTIMWHKSTSKTLGVTLKPYGSVKILTGVTKSLNTTYYDLADLNGNIVGKLFNDLKLFVIEDQELLFAMSYKSNRSWTLPNYTVGINDNVVTGCPVCTIDFSYIAESPTTINGSNGTLYIYNIINQIPQSTIILSISGQTTGNIYFNQITGNTLVTGLTADLYHVIIHDLGALNCQGKLITISGVTSNLKLYDVTPTASGLDSDFNISPLSPTVIRVYFSDIGQVFGSASVAIKSIGVSPNPSDWVSLASGGYVVFSTLTFMSPYTIYVRDSAVTGVTVSKNYIAAGNPLNSSFIVSNQAVDSGGTYVIVSNYLTTIQPNVNPIVGIIEFAVTQSSTIPINWNILPIGSSIGTPMKLYINGSGSFTVMVRETYQTTEMYKITKVITIT